MTEQDRIRAERISINAELARIEHQVSFPSSENLDKQASEWLWNSEWSHERKRVWLQRYIQTVYLSNEGIEGALVRVNAGEGRVVFGTGRRMDFVTAALSRRRPKRS